MSREKETVLPQGSCEEAQPAKKKGFSLGFVPAALTGQVVAGITVLAGLPAGVVATAAGVAGIFAGAIGSFAAISSDIASGVSIYSKYSHGRVFSGILLGTGLSAALNYAAALHHGPEAPAPKLESGTSGLCRDFRISGRGTMTVSAAVEAEGGGTHKTHTLTVPQGCTALPK